MAGGPPGSVRPDWDWNRILTPHVALMIVPVVGLLAAAYWYPIRRWEAVWGENSAWGHGYLIPVIAVLIAHYRLKEFLPRRIQPCIWGLIPILVGLVFRIWSRTLKYGYPGEATFLLVVLGVILLVLGWQVLRALWVPALYLGLMIPWDTRYYDQVALPLQTFAAAAAERILALVGFTVGRQVNVLQLASGPLAVAEACSGLHLLFAFVALGVMMAYIYRRPTWERVAIMASSIPIAVLCNTIRVTLMAVASDHLFFEANRLRAGEPTWSASMPQIVSWSSMAWVGLGLIGGGLFLLLSRGGRPALDRFASPLVLAGAVVVGVVVVLASAKVTIGYATPDRLEAVRLTVLNPESVPHQAFGFAMLGLAFVIMWAELRFIDMFFTEANTSGGQGKPGEVPQAGDPAASPAQHQAGG